MRAQAAADSGWRRTPATAARRIDGPPKVTGAKLYAADFRAADMPGWPRADRPRHAAQDARRDPRVRGDRPCRARPRARRPIGSCSPTTSPRPASPCRSFYAGDLLCPAGKTPLYLGQPVALLIWNDFARFALARRAIQFARRRAPLRRGNRPGRREALRGRALRARCRPDARIAEDVYSPMLAGWTFPVLYQKDDRPRLGGAVGDRLRREPGLLLRRPDPRRDRCGRPRPARARSDVSRPSRSTRCSWSRRPASPGTTAARASSSS